MMKRIWFTLVFFVSALLQSIACAQNQSYTPQIVSPIINLNCWNKIESLNDYLVYCGTEDESENLWFATDQGLIKYDGYDSQLIEYPMGFTDSTSFQVYAKDSLNIYIVTNKGLLLFKNSEWNILIQYEDKEAFSQAPIQMTKNRDLLFYSRNEIYRIEDRQLTLLKSCPDWIKGILSFKEQLWILITPELHICKYENGEIQELSKQTISNVPPHRLKNNGLSLISDGESEVWLIGDYKTPLVYDFQTQQFVISDVLNIIGKNHLLSGVFIGNKEKDFLVFGKNVIARRNKGKWEGLDVSKMMPTNSVFHFKRKNQNLIVGGLSEKCYEIDYTNKRWMEIHDLHFQCEDKDLNQWFLDKTGNIIEYRKQEDHWIKHTGNIIDTPNSIQMSTNGYLWTSGSHQGKAAISYFNGTNWSLNQHPSLKPSIHQHSFLERRDGTILFGAYGENEVINDGGNDISGGAVAYRKNGAGYTHKVLKFPMASPKVVDIVESENSLWFSAVKLYQKNENSRIKEVRLPNPNTHWIDSFIKDNHNHLWLGLWEQGLYKWDGHEWEHFNKPNQLLSTNVINMIFDDWHQKLWIATKRGISLYDSNQQQWIPNAISNLQLQREATTLRLENNGALWINTASRNWYIRENNDVKNIDFKTKRYLSDQHAPKVWINQHEKEITEPANIFISWGGIDYLSKTAKEDLTYSYRINNSTWSAFESTNSKIFLNLTPGHHRIEIRCRDLDGNISKVPAMSTFDVKAIIIKRKWFIASVIVTIAIIICLTVLLVRQRILNIIQLEEFKLQFFTNISHELRTPLTVILSPLENYIKKSPNDSEKNGLLLAHRSAVKMLRLVDQILEFRKIEMGKIEHRYIHGDVISSIRETVNLIKPLAEKNKQTLTLTFSTTAFIGWYDVEKLEKIVDNLLLNAIKYTPEDGEISIRLSIQTTKAKDDQLEIIVEDNGVGIPENRIQQIFEPYIRLNNKRTTRARGTGLGLTFVKSLVESLNGSIDVISPITKHKEEHCGTRFKVSVPILKKQQLETTESEIEQQNQLSETIENKSGIELKLAESKNNKPTLLLAEDEPDILEYLSNELSHDFSVARAKNGRAAYKIAVKQLPDIIVTDVMMLHMDGRQLCEKIKATPETSHIPVIMLTALKATEHELHGLEKGADDYLVKPINISVLKQRIHNQLNMRKQLRKKFSKASKYVEKMQIKPLSNNATDEAFLEQFFEIIQTSYENPLFDVELLSKKMHMNRSTLYRKIKSITGKTPSQHIKDYRMEIAIQLLEDRSFNISEISDQVGFHEVSYFSTAFKKQFQMSPKEYREQN